MVFDDYTGVVRCVKISADGSYIVSASDDSSVHLWNRDQNEVFILTGHTDRVREVEISPDSSYFVSASFDRTLRIWNKDGNEVAILEGHIVHIIFTCTSLE